MAPLPVIRPICPQVSSAGSHRKAPGSPCACAAWHYQEAQVTRCHTEGGARFSLGTLLGALHTSGGDAGPGPQRCRPSAFPCPGPSFAARPAPPSQGPKEDWGFCVLWAVPGASGTQTPEIMSPKPFIGPLPWSAPHPPSPGHARTSRAMAAMMPERTKALTSRAFLRGGHRTRSPAPTETRGPSPLSLP